MSEHVNPLSLIRAFGMWCEANHLDPMAELLWYKLFQLFNRLGWPEWVQIDLLRLAAMIGKREATVIEHRDSLIRHGLLGYQKGRKGYPSKYGMKFPTLGVGNPVGQSVGNSVGQSVRNPVGETATIYRHRHRQDIEIDLRDKKIYYNDSWRSDARAARAVAQNILDSLPKLQPDGYPNANGDISFYLLQGMAPEQVLEGLADCKQMSYVPAHLHTHAVFLGLEGADDE